MRNENISVASNLRVFYRSFAIIHRWICWIWGVHDFQSVQYYMKIIENKISQAYCHCCLNELRHKLRPERCDLQWFWRFWAPGNSGKSLQQQTAPLAIQGPGSLSQMLQDVTYHHPEPLTHGWNPVSKGEVRPGPSETEHLLRKPQGEFSVLLHSLWLQALKHLANRTRPFLSFIDFACRNHEERHEKTTMAGRPDWGSLENSPWRKGPHGAWASWGTSSTNPYLQHPQKSLDIFGCPKSPIKYTKILWLNIVG